MMEWGCSFGGCSLAGRLQLLQSCTAHMVRIACHTVPGIYVMQLWASSKNTAAATSSAARLLCCCNLIECMLQDHCGEAPLWSKACATVSSVNFRAG